MLELWRRLLNDPVVAVGVIVSGLILVLKLTQGQVITTQDIVEIFAPFTVGLSGPTRVTMMNYKRSRS